MGGGGACPLEECSYAGTPPLPRPGGPETASPIPTIGRRPHQHRPAGGRPQGRPPRPARQPALALDGPHAPAAGLQGTSGLTSRWPAMVVPLPRWSSSRVTASLCRQARAAGARARPPAERSVDLESGGGDVGGDAGGRSPTGRGRRPGNEVPGAARGGLQVAGRPSGRPGALGGSPVPVLPAVEVLRPALGTVVLDRVTGRLVHCRSWDPSTSGSSGARTWTPSGTPAACVVATPPDRSASFESARASASAFPGTPAAACTCVALRTRSAGSGPRHHPQPATGAPPAGRFPCPTPLVSPYPAPPGESPPRTRTGRPPASCSRSPIGPRPIPGSWAGCLAGPGNARGSRCPGQGAPKRG